MVALAPSDEVLERLEKRVLSRFRLVPLAQKSACAAKPAFSPFSAKPACDATRREEEKTSPPLRPHARCCPTRLQPASRPTWSPSQSWPQSWPQSRGPWRLRRPLPAVALRFAHTAAAPDAARWARIHGDLHGSTVLTPCNGPLCSHRKLVFRGGCCEPADTFLRSLLELPPDGRPSLPAAFCASWNAALGMMPVCPPPPVHRTIVPLLRCLVIRRLSSLDAITRGGCDAQISALALAGTAVSRQSAALCRAYRGAPLIADITALAFRALLLVPRVPGGLVTDAILAKAAEPPTDPVLEYLTKARAFATRCDAIRCDLRVGPEAEVEPRNLLQESLGRWLLLLFLALASAQAHRLHPH